MLKTFWISLIILLIAGSSWALNEQLPGLEEDNTAMTNEELRSLSIVNQIKSDGKLDMYNKPIDNVEDPTDPQDAATKAYVDAIDLWEVDGTEHQLKIADEIDMRSKNIINVLDPTADQHAATKKYHDDNALWETDGGDAELKTADTVDMQNLEIKGMCLENRTDDTGCTQTGRIWFRTNP